MVRFFLFVTILSMGSLSLAGNHFSRPCTSPSFSNQCEGLDDGGTLSDEDCLKVVNNMGSEGRNGAGNGINDACCDSSINKYFTGFDADAHEEDACENFDVKLIDGGDSIQVEVKIDEDTCTGKACGPYICGHEFELFESFKALEQSESKRNDF